MEVECMNGSDVAEQHRSTYNNEQRARGFAWVCIARGIHANRCKHDHRRPSGAQDREPPLQVRDGIHANQTNINKNSKKTNKYLQINLQMENKH